MRPTAVTVSSGRQNVNGDCDESEGSDEIELGATDDGDVYKWR